MDGLGTSILEEGIEIGIEKGIEKRIESIKIEDIKSLMKNMKWTVEQAMAALEIPENQRADYRKKIFL